MEYTQWVKLCRSQITFQRVLILVVMEYTQWGRVHETYCRTGDSLNPCCNGIYSMRLISKGQLGQVVSVLILVVMEYTQWGSIDCQWAKLWKSLNPCCNGIYSMSRWKTKTEKFKLS